jgi:hypothetical protein
MLPGSNFLYSVYSFILFFLLVFRIFVNYSIFFFLPFFFPHFFLNVRSSLEIVKKIFSSEEGFAMFKAIKLNASPSTQYDPVDIISLLVTLLNHSDDRIFKLSVCFLDDLLNRVNFIVCSLENKKFYINFLLLLFEYLEVNLLSSLFLNCRSHC